MSKPRKTVEAAVLVEKLNTAIQAKSGNREAQESLCFAAESVLCEANAYAGFQHARDGEIMPLELRQTIDSDHPDYYSRRYYPPRSR